jgi:membrane protease YdiL (CAAX protease family)
MPDSLEQVEKLTDALFGPYFEAGLLGALTIGLSAGIGEEIVFRGAAQKRLGLIFTSILFAVLHAQYSVSPALIQILVLGLLLGMTRRRANTTTAIAAHASYNFLLVAIGLYLPEFSP